MLNPIPNTHVRNSADGKVQRVVVLSASNLVREAVALGFGQTLFSTDYYIASTKAARTEGQNRQSYCLDYSYDGTSIFRRSHSLSSSFASFMNSAYNNVMIRHSTSSSCLPSFLFLFNTPSLRCLVLKENYFLRGVMFIFISSVHLL